MSAWCDISVLGPSITLAHLGGREELFFLRKSTILLAIICALTALQIVVSCGVELNVSLTTYEANKHYGASVTLLAYVA